MRTIRNGKIARLPAEVREQLNQRMANHESSTTLLAWLNALPEVQAVVAQEFGGKAVMRQNLSEWRHGGWAEWRQEQAALEMVVRIGPEARAANGAAKWPVADVLATWVAARYAVGMKRQMERDGDSPAAWERMREFCQDVVALRRGEYRAQRLEFERVRASAKEELRMQNEEIPSGARGATRPTSNEQDKGEHSTPNIQYLTSKEIRSGPSRMGGGCELATGKSPAPAGWKACPTSENRSAHQTG